MEEYSVESSFTVWDDKEGVGIRVGCDPDCPEVLCISTPNAKGKEWYGDIHLTMSVKHAKAFIEAIQKQINAMEG